MFKFLLILFVFDVLGYCGAENYIAEFFLTF